MKKLLFLSVLLITICSCSKEPQGKYNLKGVWSNTENSFQFDEIIGENWSDTAFFEPGSIKYVFLESGEYQEFLPHGVTAEGNYSISNDTLYLEFSKERYAWYIEDYSDDKMIISQRSSDSLFNMLFHVELIRN